MVQQQPGSAQNAARDLCVLSRNDASETGSDGSVNSEECDALAAAKSTGANCLDNVCAGQDGCWRSLRVGRQPLEH